MKQLPPNQAYIQVWEPTPGVAKSNVFINTDKQALSLLLGSIDAVENLAQENGRARLLAVTQALKEVMAAAGVGITEVLDEGMPVSRDKQ